MFFLIALMLAVAPAPASDSVTIYLGKDQMTLNPECAQVVIESGYENVHDIHSKLSGTPEYIGACF